MSHLQRKPQWPGWRCKLLSIIYFEELFSSYVYRVGFLTTHVDKLPRKSCAVTWLWRYNLHQFHQPNLCNYVPLLFPGWRNSLCRRIQFGTLFSLMSSYWHQYTCKSPLITLERAVWLSCRSHSRAQVASTKGQSVLWILIRWCHHFEKLPIYKYRPRIYKSELTSRVLKNGRVE